MQKYLLLPLYLCLSFLGQAQDVTVDVKPIIVDQNGNTIQSGSIDLSFARVLSKYITN